MSMLWLKKIRDKNMWVGDFSPWFLQEEGRHGVPGLRADVLQSYQPTMAGPKGVPKSLSYKRAENYTIFFSFLKAATKKQKYEKISEKKLSTPIEVLCKVRDSTAPDFEFLTHFCPPLGEGFSCRVCNVLELLPRPAVRRGTGLHVPAAALPHPLSHPQPSVRLHV